MIHSSFQTSLFMEEEWAKLQCIAYRCRYKSQSFILTASNLYHVQFCHVHYQSTNKYVRQNRISYLITTEKSLLCKTKNVYIPDKIHVRHKQNFPKKLNENRWDMNYRLSHQTFLFLHNQYMTIVQDNDFSSQIRVIRAGRHRKLTGNVNRNPSTGPYEWICLSPFSSEEKRIIPWPGSARRILTSTLPWFPASLFWIQPVVFDMEPREKHSCTYCF